MRGQSGRSVGAAYAWVDMLAGDVLSMAADGTIDRRHVGNVAAVLRPRRRGGSVIGVERGFVLEDAEGHSRTWANCGQTTMYG